MALIPRSFSELLDCTFIIPPYQRGYRWDEEQVTALLEDLKEFIRAGQMLGAAPEGFFYCLQPIVVVPAGDNYPGDSNNPRTPLQGKYSVIDGQQRLTTIFLLLNYLKLFGLASYDIFSLRLPARQEQESYLTTGQYQSATPEANDFIDNFYVRRAYETIERWFNLPENQYMRFNFARILTEPVQPDIIQRNVRIIWYEINDMTAPEAFRRLNYGKIPLRSAELVKALLLQKTGAHVSAPYRRAVEWDNIEHTLNHPLLWSMLVDTDEDAGARMELLLDFVSDELNQQMAVADEATGNEKLPFVRKPEAKLASDPDARDYFNYHVINEYIQRNAGDRNSREAAIERVWTRIRETFNLITNWYDSREWYHLIGLLRVLRGKKGRSNRRAFVREIYSKSFAGGAPVSRPDFSESLRKSVCESICIKGDKTVELLRYHADDKALRDILTAFNVYVTINSTDKSSRFSFSDFEKYNVTSLEHIHPQNITTDDGYDDFCRWFGNRCDDVEALTEAEWKSIVAKNETDPDDEYLSRKVDERKERINQARQNIGQRIADKATFNSEKEIINRNVKVFDSLFGDLSGISEDELHSISNLALVDVMTNAALQNYFLDRKRGILQEREAARITYVPVATHMVFSKHWSSGSPGDMRLWRKCDRDLYLSKILHAYNYFTSKTLPK